MDLLLIASVSCLVISLIAVVYVTFALRRLKPVKKETERRVKDYPATYPSGWYKLADSKDLKPGDVKQVETCGKQFVIFRGRDDKKVGVLDALCIHLGANLGLGGKVVGDCIQCPFHMWEFDKDGKCQKIPYNDQVPERAQTTTYPTIEYYGLVLVWFDPSMKPPKYFPPPFPDMDSGKMVYIAKTTRDIGMHLIEIAENSADWRHFETLHTDMKLPYTSIPLPLTIIHKTSWRLGTVENKDPHVIYVVDAAHICFRGKEIPNTTATAEITYIGPSTLMLFRFDTPVGIMTMFQTHLPIDQLNSHTEMVWYAEKKVWRALAWYIMGNWISQWQNDIHIWDNKTFLRKPFVVKGDGPIMRFRRWWFQFYDAQVQIQYESEDKQMEDKENVCGQHSSGNLGSTPKVAPAAPATTLTKRACSNGMDW